MKNYNKKMIFGAICVAGLVTLEMLLITQPNAKEMWSAIVFIFAMKAGLLIWMILLVRDHKQKIQEKLRRDGKK